MKQIVFVFFLVFLFISCQTVDLVPFSQASVKMYEGIDKSGIVFRDAAIKVYGKDNVTVNKFEEEWKSRLEAAKAISIYAEALTSLSSAGTSWQQNKDGFKSAIDDLFTKFSAVTDPSTGIVVDTVFAIGGELYNSIVQAISLKSLGEAVEKSDKAISEITKIMIKDLEEMQKMLEKVENAATVDYETDPVIENEKEYYNFLIIKKIDLMNIIMSGWEEEKDRIEEFNNLVTQINNLKSKIDANDHLIQQIELRYISYYEIIERSIEALKLLRHYHSELGPAIKNKRQINTSTLIYAAEQITTTIEKIDKIMEDTL